MKVLFRILMVAAALFAALNLVNGQDVQIHKFQNKATGKYATVVFSKTSWGQPQELYVKEEEYSSTNVIITDLKNNYVLCDGKKYFKTTIRGINQKTDYPVFITAFSPRSETEEAKDNGSTIRYWDHFTLDNKGFNTTSTTDYNNTETLTRKPKPKKKR